MENKLDPKERELIQGENDTSKLDYRSEEYVLDDKFGFELELDNDFEEYKLDSKFGFEFEPETGISDTISLGIEMAKEPEKPTNKVVDIAKDAGKGFIRSSIETIPETISSLVTEYVETGRQGLEIEDMSFMQKMGMATPFGQAEALRKIISKPFFEVSDVDDKVVAAANKSSEFISKKLDEAGFKPEGENRLAFDVGSGFASLATALGMTYLSGGNPQAASVLFGTIQKGSMYKEARGSGIDPDEAAQISNIAGISEAAMEGLGLGVFFRMANLKSPLIRVITRTITEMFQESGQQASEEIISNISGVRDTSLKESATRVAYAGLIGGLVGGPTSVAVDFAEKSNFVKELVNKGVEPSKAQEIANDIMEASAKDLDSQKVALESIEKLQTEEGLKEVSESFKDLQPGDIIPEDVKPAEEDMIAVEDIPMKGDPGQKKESIKEIEPQFKDSKDPKLLEYISRYIGPKEAASLSGEERLEVGNMPSSDLRDFVLDRDSKNIDIKETNDVIDKDDTEAYQKWLENYRPFAEQHREYDIPLHPAEDARKMIAEIGVDVSRDLREIEEIESFTSLAQKGGELYGDTGSGGKLRSVSGNLKSVQNVGGPKKAMIILNKARMDIEQGNPISPGAKKIIKEWRTLTTNIQEQSVKIDSELVDLVRLYPEITNEEIFNIEKELEKEDIWDEEKLSRAIEIYTKEEGSVKAIEEKIEERPVETPRRPTIDPIPGQGKVKTRGMSKHLSERAIENSLTEGFDNLPQYKTADMSYQAKITNDLIYSDYAIAKDIAMGKRKAPKGMIPESMYIAVENKAISEGDVDTLYDLATSSSLNEELTTMGQRIRAVGERNAESPIGAIKSVIKVREKNNKGKDNQESQDLKELKEKLDALEQKLSNLEKDSSGKKRTISNKTGFGKANKVFTEDKLNKARESIKKKMSGLHSGIDPTVLIDLTKIGGYYFEGGIRNFNEWSDKLISDLGEKVRPYLERVWDKVHSEYYEYQVDSDKDRIKELAEEGREISDLSYLTQSMAEAFVNLGITDRKNLVDKIHSELLDVYPNLTKRQVADSISGYGKYKELNDDKAKVILRDIKGQLQQISKLQDLRKGKPPLKTGIERREMSDDERRLVKIVEEAKKRYGVKTVDPKLQLKSALGAYKKNLKNQIKDLEKQIRDRKKIVKNKTSLKLDDEAKELLDIKRALQKDFSKVFGKPVMSDDQRLKIATATLNRSIEIYERKIESRDFTPINKKRDPVSSPEVDRLRSHRDKLKRQYTKLKEASKPKASPEEIALKTLKSRLESERRRIEDKIGSMDFSVKEKKEFPIDEDAKNLKEEVARLRREYKAAKDAKSVITKEEVEQITKLSKNMYDKKANISDSSEIMSEERMEFGRAQADFFDYINALKDKENKMTLIENLKSPKKVVVETAGLTKSLKASLDNSVIGRQGLKTLITNPGIWAKNSSQTFIDIYKTFKGEDVLREIRADVLSRPNALNGLYKQENLAVGVKEEDFPTSIPEKIPFFGRFFKASENAFVGFQYRTRADVFDKLVEIAKVSNADIKGIGKVSNSLTGRGALGPVEPISQILNNFFFSPRFLMSNIDTLTAHSMNKDMGSFARKTAAINLLKIISALAGVLAIFKYYDEDSVELDPRSSDFGKVRFGNTRFDISGGMSSIVTLASRLLTMSSKSSTTKLVKPLNSGKFGSRTGMDVIYNFAENKLSPAASIVRDLMKGEDFHGRKPSLSTVTQNLTVPIIFQNYQELKKDPNSAPVLVSMIADALGIGSNTYSSDVDWSLDDKKQLSQFREKVGEERFKKSNDEYNKRYREWFDKIQKNKSYKSKSEEDKAKVIQRQRIKIKNYIFRKNNFKYRRE